MLHGRVESSRVVVVEAKAILVLDLAAAAGVGNKAPSGIESVYRETNYWSNY